mgnify:CR=1 FL=1
MHALIEFCGKQFRVEEGSSIKVPRLKEKVGSKISVENILYLEDGKTKALGKPFLSDKKMDAEVISHGKGRKVVVFKFKRRKGYQVKNTHRDEYTILKFGKLGMQKKQSTTKKAESGDKKKVAKKSEVKRKPKKKKEEE